MATVTLKRTGDKVSNDQRVFSPQRLIAVNGRGKMPLTG